MDIDSYISRHQEEWKRLAESTRGGPKALARLGPERIDETIRLYQRASAHLAEVQTIYRDPRVERYLTGVVGRAHAAVYGSSSRSIARGAGRLAARYRHAVYGTLPHIGIAAGLFVAILVAMTIWVSGSREAQAGLLPPFAREVVEQASGRVDAEVPAGLLSTVILVNNVRVTLLAFALGITAGIGTAFIVAYNAVFIGALAGLYHSASKGDIFWSLVLPHGFLELTAIFIGAGAGLRIGWTLVDPGDRPRGRALTAASSEALLVLAGALPALGVAALIEGYVTGRTGSAAAEIAIGAVVTILYLGLILGVFARRRATDGPSP